MSAPLSLKYRPQKFSDMVGQELNARTLQKLVDKNAVPHALLISGPSGTGKTTAARILAMELNPSQSGEILEGSSIDVVEVDAASNGGVEDVRRLMDTLRYQASSSATRVVIYDEAHEITRAGWNALLKPTEEDFGTVFIFVTTEPEKVPPTMLSRLREYEMYRVSPYDIAKRLAFIVQQEGIQIEGPLLSHLAETANGNVRGAIMLLDQATQADITTLEEYVEVRGEADRAPDLIRAMLTNDFSLIATELDDQLASTGNPQRITNDLVQCFSDLLVVRAGGKTEHIGKPEQDRRELAYLTDQERIIAAMRVIWDLKTRVKNSSNPAADVRLAVTLVSNVLTRGRVPAPSAPAPVQAPAPAPVEKVVEEKKISEPAPAKKLSLSEMMQARS